MASEPTEPSFAARARHEAQRYGADRLVFVRELVQNARDAGARGVEIEVFVGPRAARIVCRDDGEGMTFEHARLYLFKLYASSKSRGAAGRFGVGFWSVLRFAPSSVEVRSWPAHGTAWAVRLDGSLRSARAVPARPRPSSGTEIVLEAERHEPELRARIDQALRHYCREVRQRDAPGRLILITLDGRGAHGTLDLEAPRTRFRRGALRGAVGLAEQPQALVYSQGLLVREASFLDDLLLPDDARPRPAVPDLDEGLAPRALLDHRALQPLLSRNDVHDSRPLRRAVRLAQLEMGRLVDRQLGQAAPRSWRTRARDILAGVSPGAALVAGIVTALILASAWAGLARWPRTRSSSPPSGQAPTSTPLRHPGPSLYRDLSRLYAGPDTGPLADSLAPVDLTYRPATETPLLRALAIDSLDDPSASTRRPLRPAPLAEPVDGGLAVSLLAAPEPGELRLPVPTGHQVDAASVLLDGQQIPLFLSSLGEPVVRLPRSHHGRLQYRTGPARALRSAVAVPEDPPEELSREAARLRGWPIDERVVAATKWTRGRVTGSREATVAQQHAQARRGGEPFLTRALSIGAGDCDVQNGVLVELLRLSGVPARLAVGYVGREGRALPWLHAWAEYQPGDGGWRAADASVSPQPALPRLADEPVAVAAPPRAGQAPPARVPSHDTGSPRGLGIVAVATLLVPLLLLAALRRTRRSMALDPSPDVARLLQGALRHPDAFREAPAVFHRPLVPLHSPRRASLLRAWTEASHDRLYCARQTGSLTRTVAQRALVVDAGQPEGAAVAQGLGAVDLDHWQRLLDRSHASPPLDDVARRLSGPGPRIRARILPGLQRPISLAFPTGPGPRGGEHLVLAPDQPPWNDAAGPSRSLEIAEALLDRLDLPGPCRAERLATLSRRLLLEAFAR